MEDFIKFRKMITPLIIQILFWVGVAITVISALWMMGTSFGRFGGGAGQFLGGLIFLVVGPVLVRVYTELLILFFRMNETLTEIRDLLASK
jgi:hypothetical protein